MIRVTDTALRRYFFNFARATGRAIAIRFTTGGGKSGQQRVMYRLIAGVIKARATDTESATENNHLFAEALAKEGLRQGFGGRVRVKT